MQKYIVVLLDDNAVSYCHYSAKTTRGISITPEVLKKTIFWAMRENLSVQFVYSRANVSDEISSLIETIDHTDIGPSNADIVVYDSLEDCTTENCIAGQSYVVRTQLEELFSKGELLESFLPLVDRINIVITDVEKFSESHIKQYQAFLVSLIPAIVNEYKLGHQVQFNLLTDRLMLKEMNNCNAGYESITLAPNGNFYICPAFYFNNGPSVGDIENGLDIKNSQLYKLDYAPICRVCDAFQCKRCIWLNKRMCREVNTPSHQQCTMAHVERNASKKLLEEFRKIDGTFLNDVDIPGVNYLDPYDKVTKQR